MTGSPPGLAGPRCVCQGRGGSCRLLRSPATSNGCLPWVGPSGAGPGDPCLPHICQGHPFVKHRPPPHVHGALPSPRPSRPQRHSPALPRHLGTSSVPSLPLHLRKGPHLPGRYRPVPLSLRYIRTSLHIPSPQVTTQPSFCPSHAPPSPTPLQRGRLSAQKPATSHGGPFSSWSQLQCHLRRVALRQPCLTDPAEPRHIMMVVLPGPRPHPGGTAAH